MVSLQPHLSLLLVLLRRIRHGGLHFRVVKTLQRGCSHGRTPRLFLTTVFFFFFFAVVFAIASAAEEPHGFLQSEKLVKKPVREKLSHLRFYWHDVLSGPDPTAVPVAQAAASSTNASASGFGKVFMIDDPMTVGPELSSRLVGRAQGFYALAAKEETALLMALNLAFLEGKYNGSTIAILGRNAVFSGVREMPVVGGSGLFRLARGYAQARTYSLDPRTGDAVVEYNVFVMHY